MTTQTMTNKQKQLKELTLKYMYSKNTGYKVQYEGETVKTGCSDLPANLPENLLVNLTSLGGHVGLYIYIKYQVISLQNIDL